MENGRRRRGGQPGNQNARRHGLYSQSLDPTGQANLRRARRANPENLDEEIALLRARLMTAGSDDAHPAAPLELQLQLLRTLAQLVALRHRLSPRQTKGLSDALARTIEEVRKAVQEWVAKPGPMIIDSRISRAVINLPMRRTLYGKDE